MLHLICNCDCHNGSQSALRLPRIDTTKLQLVRRWLVQLPRDDFANLQAIWLRRSRRNQSEPTTFMFINFLVVVALSARRLSLSLAAGAPSETLSFAACGSELAKCAKKTWNKEMRSHKGTNLDWLCVLFAVVFRALRSFAFVWLGCVCMCEYV